MGYLELTKYLVIFPDTFLLILLWCYFEQRLYFVYGELLYIFVLLMA